MSDLRELYQEVILDHGKKPRNHRVLEGADHKADGHNPLCGDKITVFVKTHDDQIEEVSFEGTGCAISTASASMMTETVRGRTVEDVKLIFGAFHQMVTAEEDPGTPAGLPPKLVVFCGVRAFPMRVKCATLAWHTLRAALDRRQETVTTES
jgi:nitrogen fixation NifU-like protein